MKLHPRKWVGKGVRGALLSAGFAVLTAASSYAQTEVYSNIVGYQRVTVPSNGFALVSSPFDSGTNASVQEVVGPQLTGSTGAADADLLLLWDQDSSSYIQLYLHSLAAQWVDTSVVPNVLATNEIPHGLGFWLQNNQESNQSVVVVGDIVVDSVVTNTITPGFQLVSYPFSTDIPLNDSALTNGYPGDFANADNILIWDPAEQVHKQMYLISNPGTPVHRKWVDTSVVPNIIATNVLHTGEGFWYLRKAAGGDFDWVEARPYAIP